MSMIQSVLDLPCYEFSLKLLIDEAPHVLKFIDPSKIVGQDASKRIGFRPDDLRDIILKIPNYTIDMVKEFNAKLIYAKCYEASAVDKEHMDISLDPIRARMQQEYNDIQDLKENSDPTEEEN